MNMGEEQMSDRRKLTRHESREMVYKLLFAREFHRDADINGFYNSFVEDIEDIFGDYVQNTFFGAADAEAELDAEIEAASIKWKMSRMSISTRCALRLAAYEMTKTDLPAKIAINEALEIVKTYDDESAPAFVNGILNKIAREHGLITPPAAE